MGYVSARVEWQPRERKPGFRCNGGRRRNTHELGQNGSYIATLLPRWQRDNAAVSSSQISRAPAPRGQADKGPRDRVQRSRLEVRNWPAVDGVASVGRCANRRMLYSSRVGCVQGQLRHPNPRESVRSSGLDPFWLARSTFLKGD